jgi:hypothetical protein
MSKNDGEGHGGRLNIDKTKEQKKEKQARNQKRKPTKNKIK